MVRLVRAVLIYAFGVEAVFAVVLAARWLPEFGWPRALWVSAFHTISAFNNAGFDIMGDFRSMSAYVDDPVVNLCISTLFILGGIGFSVVLNLWELRERRLSTHSRLALLVTGWLIGVGVLVIGLLEWANTLAPLSGTESSLVPTSPR